MSVENVQKNVLGTQLKECSCEPVTGWFRDGFCSTDEHDHGVHTVCAVLTEDFLLYSKSQGNDLITPRPQFQFPGLVAGNKWCLCANRWLEAFKEGKAPEIMLESTHEKTLETIDLETLKSRAFAQ